MRSCFIFVRVFIFHRFPSYWRVAALYYFAGGIVRRRYPVTRMRNHLSTRGWMQPVVHNRSRAYKRRRKANRQWTARRFRLESYQSLSGHNSASATCYLPLRAGLSRGPPFVASPTDHNGDSSIRRRYPWSTYAHAGNVCECFLLYVCLRLMHTYYGKAERMRFSSRVLQENHC